MSNKKYIFIVNPTSGNGKSIQIFNNILKFAKEESKENEILWAYTSAKGVAKDLATLYSSKYPGTTIYSVGGDGTLNEIINGIDSNTKLGIIPAGSGNDFYRVSKNIEGSKKINLGVVNERKFINIASLGFDAKVAHEANNLKNSGKKRLVYPRAILNIIKDNEPIKYSLNGNKKESTVLIIGNGKYYGNGFPINPNYDLSNNYLNVISAPALTRKQILKFLVKVLKEKHLDDLLVTNYLIKNFKVSSNIDLLCNLDGEIITGKNFIFDIIENGVTLDNEHPQYVKRAINLIK